MTQFRFPVNLIVDDKTPYLVAMAASWRGSGEQKEEGRC